MQREVFQYLFNYSSDARKIDRLITSSFVNQKKLLVQNNTFLSQFLIDENDADWGDLISFIELLEKCRITFDFEQLIELFEFVVSPSDKIVNGAIYTPVYIRDYILNETLKRLEAPLNEAMFADFACGCGAFLFSLARTIHTKTNEPYSSIFPRLYGLDITSYSIERTKILLSLLAISEGEDPKEFQFSLFCGNALSFNFFENGNPLQANEGFDVIVGNPPYVCSRNMDKESLDLMANWRVSKSGHPDLYIPFFQIGYENLKENGLLGFITVNSFMKSINGRALREYFSENNVSMKILNFGGEQVFKDRNTYTCLCFMQKQQGGIAYKRTLSTELPEISPASLNYYNYTDLNNHDGWNLVDTEEQDRFIRNIESIGRPFAKLYTTRNGIATLRNDVYKFVPVGHNRRYYFLETKNKERHLIEKEICRPIINANKIKNNEDFGSNEEVIIFPYGPGNDTPILSEQVFRKRYPQTFAYLESQKHLLADRDKGLKEYEKWYAYGRRQSMDINCYKLFFPHICDRPNFVICETQDLLFYNGIAVISDSLRELQVLKIILESNVFFEYVKCTTKDYASGYISMSRNYIKNFGIYPFSEEQKDELLQSANPNEYLARFYALELTDTITHEPSVAH